MGNKYLNDDMKYLLGFLTIIILDRKYLLLIIISRSNLYSDFSKTLLLFPFLCNLIWSSVFQKSMLQAHNTNFRCYMDNHQFGCPIMYARLVPVARQLMPVPKTSQKGIARVCPCQKAPCPGTPVPKKYARYASLKQGMKNKKRPDKI